MIVSCAFLFDLHSTVVIHPSDYYPIVYHPIIIPVFIIAIGSADSKFLFILVNKTWIEVRPKLFHNSKTYHAIFDLTDCAPFGQSSFLPAPPSGPAGPPSHSTAVPPAAYFMAKDNRKLFASGRSPNKISTVLTNVQRRNIQTAAPPVSKDMTVHQLAAQGELIHLEEKCSSPDFVIDARDSQGLTALHWACANGQKAAVELLLLRRADVGVVGDNGENALLLAACYGHRDIAALLLDKGMDINSSDELGNTALMFAAFNDHAQCASLLVEWGADLTLENEDGYTAMELACARKSRLAQQVIEKHVMNALQHT